MSTPKQLFSALEHAYPGVVTRVERADEGGLLVEFAHPKVGVTQELCFESDDPDVTEVLREFGLALEREGKGADQGPSHVLPWAETDRDPEGASEHGQSRETWRYVWGVLLEAVAEYFERGEEVPADLRAAYLVAVRSPSTRKPTGKTVRYREGREWRGVPVDVRDFAVRLKYREHRGTGMSRQEAIDELAASFDLDQRTIRRALDD